MAAALRAHRAIAALLAWSVLLAPVASAASAASSGGDPGTVNVYDAIAKGETYSWASNAILKSLMTQFQKTPSVLKFVEVESATAFWQLGPGDTAFCVVHVKTFSREMMGIKDTTDAWGSITPKVYLIPVQTESSHAIQHLHSPTPWTATLNARNPKPTLCSVCLPARSAHICVGVCYCLASSLV